MFELDFHEHYLQTGSTVEQVVLELEFGIEGTKEVAKFREDFFVSRGTTGALFAAHYTKDFHKKKWDVFGFEIIFWKYKK